MTSASAQRLLPTDSVARPADCLTAALHHLELSSPDPAGLARFYQQALGYACQQQSGRWIGTAPGRLLGFTAGPAKTLASVGFSVLSAEELHRLRGRIDSAGWLREDGPSDFFADAVRVRDPDGTAYVFGLTRALPAPAAAGAALAARLQHVVVASRDPLRLSDFFTKVLGFTVSDHVVDEQGGIRTIFLRCSADHHSLAVFLAPSDRLDHHCYETTSWNDIRDWADHFAAQSIALEWGPGRHGPGNNLFVFVHDPDGNWVELSAELEQVAHDRPVGQWRHEERTLNRWGQGKLRS